MSLDYGDTTIPPDRRELYLTAFWSGFMLAFNKLLCFLLGHQYGRVTNKMIDLPQGGEFCGCKRCRKLFVIHHELRFIFDWDDIRNAFGLSHNPFANKG